MALARRDPRNLTHYWRDPRVPGLTLMCSDFTTQEFAPHSHDALVVAVTESGGAEIKSRGHVERAHRSTLFVFNPAEPHAGWMGWSDRWKYRSMYLTRSALDLVAAGLGIGDIPYFTRNRFTDGDLIDGFLGLHRALQANADALREEELLVGTFGRLFRRHGSGDRPSGRVMADRALLDRALDLMQDRYGEPLRLDDLSAVTGLTKFQLIGLFNRQLGMSPHAYLTQVRLKAACRLLKGNLRLAEIAAAAGFYDQSAMTRHFKRRYGITPMQYADAVVGRPGGPSGNFRQ